MSRGLLDENELRHIADQLPDLSDLQHLKGGLAPDTTALVFPPQSWIPVAGVALIDAIETAEEAAHALHECLAHRTWYRERHSPPDEIAAAFFGRFYATDLALRIYAGGEHLANAIIFMLEIDEAELTQSKRPRASQASNVGHFLLRSKCDHPITRAIADLGRSREWQETSRYRNRWTHQQPPTISQLGLVYRRKRPWSDLSGGIGQVLNIGGSDRPEYSVDDLLGFMTPAFFGFVTTMRQVLRWYTDYLRDRGIRLRWPGETPAGS